MRYWLLDSGLPAPEPQVRHAQLRQFGRDLERYSLMSSTGWLLLRFGGSHLSRRATIVDRVSGALRSRGARW